MSNFELTNDCSSSENGCTYVKMFYPEFSGPNSGEINNEIELFIRTYGLIINSDSNITITQASQATIQSYNDFKVDFPESSQTWFSNVNSKVLTNSDRLLSFYIECQTYFGGAHPNTMRKYWNLKKTGEKLQLSEIGRNQDYLGNAEIAFRNKYAPDSVSLNEQGYSFNEDKFSLPENFGVKDNFIVFYYNPYEVASYAQGALEFEIPIY